MKAIFLAITLVVIPLFALPGCATKAQQEASRVQGVATTDAPGIDACWVKVLRSAPHQALRLKMGDYADSPTLAMKISPDKATAAEGAQLLALQQDELLPCRKMAVESAGKVDPAIVAILADSYAATDANYQRFVTREITWGEFVNENQALITRRRAALLAAGESLQRSAAASQAPAPAQQQAASALEAWTRRQQILLQDLPAPRIIDCRYAGSVLECDVTPSAARGL
jgi:hypothetical protein